MKITESIKNLTNIFIRPVVDSDLPAFYLHQADAEAARMADFPSRDETAFYAHWRKIMADPLTILRTIQYDGQVVGNVVSFVMEGNREVGYWLGCEFWGKGIASAALRLFLMEVTERPLYGVAANSNPASMRVLEKCGFVLDRETQDERIYRLD